MLGERLSRPPNLLGIGDGVSRQGSPEIQQDVFYSSSINTNTGMISFTSPVVETSLHHPVTAHPLPPSVVCSLL